MRQQFKEKVEVHDEVLLGVERICKNLTDSTDVTEASIVEVLKHKKKTCTNNGEC